MDPFKIYGSRQTKDPDKEEIEMPSVEDENQLENSKPENQAEISLEIEEEQSTDDSTAADAAEPLPGESDDPLEGDLDFNADDDTDDAPMSENPAAADGIGDETAADEKTPGSEGLPGSRDGGINDTSEENLQPDPSVENQTDDFEGLDDDEIVDIPLEQQPPESKENMPDKNNVAGESEEAAAEENEDRETFKENIPLKEVAEETTSSPKAPNRVAGFSLVNKMISGALIALIIAGVVLYFNPSLIGLTRAQVPAAPGPVTAGEPVAPIVPPVTAPAAPDKRDQCLAKIEEAVRLRNLLLEKNEEIYDLDLHYRTGIAELVAETHDQLKRAGATTYEAALNNKRIELNMRTIQRRQAYINGLVKPAFWLNSGSEELYYLVRKAQLDMQLTDIAGGIDLKKHMRHMDAAIQKYRPSPDKLAVDPQQSKVPPLEKIWQRVSRKEQADVNQKKKEPLALNPKDKRIINEICAGNFERIAELTNITGQAAGCVARMNGSDLFLNGLMTLSPDAAEQLFQWRGNWVCLNGVKHLSPATAQYLFNWKGNWILLNSLSDFPPELVEQLLKWEGQQLELMGLKYEEDEATQKTLKYLALWETTGGKLFVPDKVRQKIESLM